MTTLVLVVINPMGWVTEVHDFSEFPEGEAEISRGLYDRHYPGNTHILVDDTSLIEKLTPSLRAFRLIDGALVEVPEETDRRAARKAIDSRTDAVNAMFDINDNRRVINLLLEIAVVPEGWSDEKKAYFNELKEHFKALHKVEDVTTVGPLTPTEATAELAKGTPVEDGS